MLVKIEDVKPGTKFSCLGVGYEMVRQTGEFVDSLNRNQWGRATGGYHKALKVVVKVDERHRGWSRPHYMVFLPSTHVIVEAV